jgi:hypothetical protein
VVPALPLSSTSTFTPPSKHPKGQILVGANKRDKSFSLVNIYLYHPNSAIVSISAIAKATPTVTRALPI